VCSGLSHMDPEGVAHLEQDVSYFRHKKTPVGIKKKTHNKVRESTAYAATYRCMSSQSCR